MWAATTSFGGSGLLNYCQSLTGKPPFTPFPASNETLNDSQLLTKIVLHQADVPRMHSVVFRKWDKVSGNDPHEGGNET